MKITMTLMIMLGILRVGFMPTTISGTSMEPSLESGEHLLTNQLAYVFADPSRGEIVCARDPIDGELVVKRVIGLPGEEVKMIWGKIYIDGLLLDEPYRHPVAGWCMLPFKLGDSEYWVIGDNRDVSSHLIVTKEDVIGRLQHANVEFD